MFRDGRVKVNKKDEIQILQGGIAHEENTKTIPVDNKDGWVNIADGLPDNYMDKKIKLSDGNVLSGYFDVKSNTWCQNMPIPLLKESDNRTVISWMELANFDSIRYKDQYKE